MVDVLKCILSILLCCIPSLSHAAPKPDNTAKTKVTHEALRKQGIIGAQRILAPLSSKPAQKGEGPKIAANALRTYFAVRWGWRSDKEARKEWRKIWKAMATWNPKVLYRKLRYKQVRHRFAATIKDFGLTYTLPKKGQPFSNKLGKGGVSVHVKTLPRKNARSERTYLYNFKAQMNMLPVRVEGFDPIVLDFMRKITSPSLSLKPTPPLQAEFSPSLKGQSRKILEWLNALFPRGIKKLLRFAEISHILTPLGKGRYKIDFQWRWRLKNFIKDYPGIRKSINNKKRKFYVLTDFFDMQQRRWLRWNYKRSEWRISLFGIMTPKGLLMCNEDWKPISKPWRPTQNLHSDWITRTHFRFASSSMGAEISDIVLRWKVRKLKNGASLSLALKQAPKLKIIGGEILRILARLVIPGGVERMFKMFMHNTAHADRGKGFRMTWSLKRHKETSRIHFDMTMPLKHNPILASILRIMSSFRRTRRRARRRRPLKKRTARKKRKRVVSKRRRRKYRRRRRRKRYPSMWIRVYKQLPRDLIEASKPL